MNQWEYYQFAFQAVNGQELQKRLDALGLDRWELCATCTFPIVQVNQETGEQEPGMVFLWVFKRERQRVMAASALS